MTTKEYIDPSEATRIRVHHEGGGAWAIDAADDGDGFTEFCWNRDGHPAAKMTRQRAIERVSEFAAEIGLPPGLRIEVEAEPPAPERRNEMNVVSVETMKAKIMTASGAVIFIERTEAVPDVEWAAALAMIDRADAVIDAAREVVENWTTSRLAESVRLLDCEVQEVEATVEEFMPKEVAR